MNKIKFEENYSVMNISSREIETGINASLKGMSGYKGCRIEPDLSTNGLKIKIAFVKNSSCIKQLYTEKMAAVLNADNVYSLTDETKAVLENGFINKGEHIKMREIKGIIVVELNPVVTLSNLFEQEEGFIIRPGQIYNIGRMLYLLIMRVPKSAIEKAKNQMNNNRNNYGNNRNNNYHNNKNNNYNNRNNNYHHNNKNNNNYQNGFRQI